MGPSSIFECLKVSHAQFGFGVLQTAFDEITLTFTGGEGSERRRRRGIRQRIANGQTFALEQQRFFTNRAGAGDRPDPVAGKLDLHLAAFSGAESDVFSGCLRQPGTTAGSDA